MLLFTRYALLRLHLENSTLTLLTLASLPLKELLIKFKLPFIRLLHLLSPPGPPPKASFPTKATSSSQPSKPSLHRRGAKADEDSDMDTHMSYESRDIPSAAAASNHKSGLSDKARRKHSKAFPDDESAEASMESEYDEVIFDITNKPYFKHARNKKKERIYIHLDLGNPPCAPGANTNAQLAWLKMFEGTTVKELNACGFRTYRSIEGKTPPLRLKGSSTTAITDANSKRFVCTFRASCTLHVDQEDLSQNLNLSFTKVSEGLWLQPQARKCNNSLYPNAPAQVPQKTAILASRKVRLLLRWVSLFAPLALCSLGAFPMLDEAFPDRDPTSTYHLFSCCQVHATKWTERSTPCTTFHRDQTAISIRTQGIPADDGADACDELSLIGGMQGHYVAEVSSSACGSDIQIVL